MSLLCPFCFCRFSAASILFRCANPDRSRCPGQPDVQLARYLNRPDSEAELLAPLFRPPSSPWQLFSQPTKARCTCGQVTTDRICPECHNTLPSEFGSQRSHFIAVLGPKEVGKSHYIGVLVHELENQFGRSLGLSLRSLDERTRLRYRSHYHRYLYQEGVALPATKSARQDPAIRFPLIYEVATPKHLWGSAAAWLGRHRRPFVLFDTAGEDLETIATMSTETRYVTEASGIILLVDPLQAEPVREVLRRTRPGLRLPEQYTTPGDLVDRVIQLCREHTKVGSGRIPMSVAVAFTKLDVLKRRPGEEAEEALLGQDEPVFSPPKHEGAYNLKDLENVSEALRARADAWLGQGFDLKLRTAFVEHRYFGLSALGSSPAADDRLAHGLSPLRVADPVLWLLHRLGLLPSSPR